MGNSAYVTNNAFTVRGAGADPPPIVIFRDSSEHAAPFSTVIHCQPIAMRSDKYSRICVGVRVFLTICIYIGHGNDDYMNVTRVCGSELSCTELGLPKVQWIYQCNIKVSCIYLSCLNDS